MLKNTDVFRLILCLTAAIAPCISGTVTPPAVQAQTQSDADSDPIGLYKQAGIDAEQEKKIRALADAYEQSADDKARTIISQLKNLKALSLNADLDEKLVLATQTSINKLQADMAMEKMHLLINIRRVLNRNQRIKLVALLESHDGKPGAAGARQ